MWGYKLYWFFLWEGGIEIVYNNNNNKIGDGLVGKCLMWKFGDFILGV